MTDKPQNGLNQEWKSVQRKSHTLDAKFDALVRFLARAAARRDYDEAMRMMQEEGNQNGNTDSFQ